ncbi:hypothetical protein COLO4_04804 [Corchorus olitorius]|uniref:Glycoside hydrolase, family 1 n=1 Tax=Corchorus olitorius TaxID=93759 RepID=A0A1R3KSV3_9ROSI|nr:hypothetical protein COLO4_04804 [Corchorus olitorius]
MDDLRKLIVDGHSESEDMKLRFVDPIMLGEYPKSMQVLLGNELPKFNETQAKQVKGSVDFLGVNYYSSSYASYVPFNESNTANYLTYARVTTSTEKDGVPIGTPIWKLDGYIAASFSKSGSSSIVGINFLSLRSS